MVKIESMRKKLYLGKEHRRKYCVLLHWNGDFWWIFNFMFVFGIFLLKFINFNKKTLAGNGRCFAGNGRCFAGNGRCFAGNGRCFAGNGRCFAGPYFIEIKN